MKRLFSFFTALCLIAALGSVTAFAATDVNESPSSQQASIIIGEFDGLLGNYLDANVPMCTNAMEESQQTPIIIGEFDGLLADYLDPNVPMPAAVANVRINSYATYDSEDGVQVKVKLYVPWFEFPKPEFTGMTGTVAVDLNNKTTSTAFAEIADGDATIESDVNTGVTGASGAKGTVTVSGVATALNALFGGDVFGISYEIQIP